MTGAAPEINFFSPRRPGPEASLEDSLIANFGDFIDLSNDWWIGGSLTLGAGQPDLLAVNYERIVGATGSIERDAIEVLAYLRVVRHARLDTIANRLRITPESARDSVRDLVDAGALAENERSISLTDPWRDVLPEVVSIEVKIADWKRAIAQATRNLVFSHRSFVAFPEELALRVKKRPEFALSGIGILSVGHGDGGVSIARRARRKSPRAWRYYYQLASRVSQDRRSRAVPRAD